MNGFPFVATLVTAIGCGIAAGVFFAFSTFVMAGLRRLPPADGIAAMQSINVTAVTPVFMTALFGTALACIALIVCAVAGVGDWEAGPVIVGAALYVVGTIGVTIVRNVPLNDRLERTRAEDPGAYEFWSEYLTRWTRWNHVRTLAALGAAVLLTLAVSA